MLPNHYITIYSDALGQPDRDAFVSDWALSSVFGEDSDLSANAITCGKLYDLSRMSVADLAKFAGLSNRQFAFRLDIPQRTMENWSAGKNAPPEWAKLLIAESVGYFDA